MDMNVESLKFDRREKFVDVYIKMIGAEQKDNFYLTEGMMETALDCLRGTAKTYPFMNNALTLPQFGDRGIRLIELNSRFDGGGGKYEEHWYNFDGEWFADLLEVAWDFPTYQEHTVSEDELEHERQRLAPVVVWEYAEGVEEAIQESINDPRVIIQKDHYGLEDIVKVLERSAENRSDGQTIKIYISIDMFTRTNEERPWCFYYEVYDGDRRLWNGGLNSHKSKEEGKWEYSSNT